MVIIQPTMINRLEFKVCNSNSNLKKKKWQLKKKRKWQSTPVFLPGEFHGQRRLSGYGPWGHKELEMTENLILKNLEVVLRLLEST